MSANIKSENRRLLESLEFIDEKLILEALGDLRLPTSEDPTVAAKSPFKHWRQFVALAACILLLSIASPLVSYVAEVISNFNAGAGSGTTEETTNDHLISQVEFDEINTAWTKKWTTYSAYCNSPDEIQYLQGPNCFYGKYNGCIVLMRQTPMDFYEEQIVNDLVFKCPGLHLWVCIDSTYYSLYSAYAEGFLTDEQISEIWELHNNIFYK